MFMKCWIHKRFKLKKTFTNNLPKKSIVLQNHCFSINNLTEILKMSQKYVALLRGINVGGKRKLTMTDLRESVLKIGFKEVSTYIQSGNLFFYCGRKKCYNFRGEISATFIRRIYLRHSGDY